MIELTKKQKSYIDLICEQEIEDIKMNGFYIKGDTMTINAIVDLIPSSEEAKQAIIKMGKVLINEEIK